MASPMTIQILAAHCGISEAYLETEVRREHFPQISHSLTQWELLSPLMDISPADMDSIKGDNHKEEVKKVSFLEVWKQKMSFKATYRVLVESLLKIKRVDDAKGICKVLASESISASSIKTTATSTHYSTISLVNPPKSPPPATDTPVPVAHEIVSTKSDNTNSQAPLTGSELEAEIARLKQDFEELVDLIEESFSSRVSLVKVQRSIKHIPVSLSQDLGSYFEDKASKFLRADSIRALFILLSPMWGYLNPGLLEFFVGRFGSQDNISELQKYLEKLNIFRQNVKLGDFVRVRHTKENALDLFRCKKIITIMGSDWENQTLQDAENFRVELAQEYNLLPFVPLVNLFKSSIAIVICLPHWLEINLDKLSGFFNRNKVKKVFVDGPIDWLKKEFHLKETRVREELQSHEAEISRLREELSKSSDKSSKVPLKLPLQLKWRRGPDMPFEMSDYVQSVQVQGTTYFGGGYTGGDDDYIAMAYYQSSSTWTKLPPYRACCFAMTVIDCHLVLVGGVGRDAVKSKALGMWRPYSKKWTHPYPDMITPRESCSAVVYNQYLVVAGGVGPGDDYLSSVEVMNTDSKQWYTGPSTPIAWDAMKTAIVDDTCYFMGGCIVNDYTNKVYSVSLPALVSQLNLNTRTDTQIWKELPQLPVWYAAPLSISGSLLSVGGLDEDDEAVSALYLYQSDAGQWVKIADMPTPRYTCTCIMISSVKELLVAGGWGKRDRLEAMDIVQLY